MKDIQIAKNYDETCVFTFKKLNRGNCTKTCAYELTHTGLDFNYVYVDFLFVSHNVDAVFVRNFGLANARIDGEAINLKFFPQHLYYVKKLVGEK